MDSSSGQRFSWDFHNKIQMPHCQRTASELPIEAWIIDDYCILLLCRLLQWMDNSECSKPIELARVVLPAVHAHIKFRAERWVPDDFGIVDFHELRCGRRTF